MSVTIEDIRQHYKQFMARPFPSGCAGREVKGISLIELDTFTAGCVGTFVGNGGSLDAESATCLNDCACELRTVVPELSGDARDYFEGLRVLTEMVLMEVRKGHV